MQCLLRLLKLKFGGTEGHLLPYLDWRKIYFQIIGVNCGLVLVLLVVRPIERRKGHPRRARSLSFTAHERTPKWETKKTTQPKQDALLQSRCGPSCIAHVHKGTYTHRKNTSCNLG